MARGPGLLRYLGATAPAWVLIETVAAAIFALCTMLFVSRVIGPNAAGIGAIALAVFLLFDLVGTMLLSDTVVQHRFLSDRHVDSAVTVSVAAGVACAGCLLLLAVPAARAAGQPQVAHLLIALAPLLPLSAYSGVVSGLVLRRQRYRLLAWRVLAGQPFGLALGLLVAAVGGGAWAMVAVQAGCTIPVTVLLAIAGRYHLRARLDLGALRALWPVAAPQFVSEVMRSGRYRVFIMLLGATSAPSVVAVCNIGFRLLDQALAVVIGSSARISLPRLAALDDREARAETYGALAQLQAMLGWPVAAGIALIAPSMIAALLGPEWAGAASATRIAAVAALATFSFGDAGSLWVAVGKTRINLLTSAASLVVPMAATLVVRPATPEAAAYCWGAASVVPAIVGGWLVLRELGRSPGWLLHKLAPAALAASLMTCAVLAAQPLLPQRPLAALFCQALLGAAVFLAVAWFAVGRKMPQVLSAPAPAAP